MSNPIQSVAIIGSGIAGLGSAYLLSKRYNVTIYERNGYVGGHSNTVDAPRRATRGEPDQIGEDQNGTDATVPVDTGFIVFNEQTYPNLLGLFDVLDVPVKKTDMSFAVSVDHGRLEYGGSDMNTIFAQRRNLLNPRFYQMLRDIVRFYRDSPSLLSEPSNADITLGEFMDMGGYGKTFANDHLLPMAAAIWSCSTETMRSFPAKSFVRFFVNHGLFNLRDRPQWWTVDGGSREYVKRITQTLAAPVMTGRPASSVERRATLNGSKVVVRDIDGAEAAYDAVVMACHGDEAFRLVSDKSDVEADILSGFKYQPNEAILHTDPAQMPRRKRAWSSWNYLSARNGNDDAVQESNVAVTYWMNMLQGVQAEQDLFVTLNPIDPIPAEHIIDQFVYDHPMFDRAALNSQQALPGIQGNGGIWYCGSYCGYGFHEDGLASAVAVAKQLGVDAPWGHRPHHAMRAVLGPDGAEMTPAKAA